MGRWGPPTLFTIPVLRYMKTYGVMHEQLAMVSVVQREWAAKNPARHLQDADHGRGRVELADDRLPVLEVVRRLGRHAHAQ
jgi:acetyl-CoA acetyltransferase